MKHVAVLAVAIATTLTPIAALAQEAAADPGATLMSLFIQHLAPVLFTGLATLLGWVFVMLAQKFGVERDTKKLSAAIERILLFANSVVAELEATLKPQLLAMTADGKLTETEIAALRKTALERLKQLAGERGLTELQALLGIAAPQVETFLMGLIEKVVGSMSAPKGGATPALVVASPQ